MQTFQKIAQNIGSTFIKRSTSLFKNPVEPEPPTEPSLARLHHYYFGGRFRKKVSEGPIMIVLAISPAISSNWLLLYPSLSINLESVFHEMLPPESNVCKRDTTLIFLPNQPSPAAVASMIFSEFFKAWFGTHFLKERGGRRKNPKTALPPYSGSATMHVPKPKSPPKKKNISTHAYMWERRREEYLLFRGIYGKVCRAWTVLFFYLRQSRQVLELWELLFSSLWWGGAVCPPCSSTKLCLHKFIFGAGSSFLL